VQQKKKVNWGSRQQFAGGSKSGSVASEGLEVVSVLVMEKMEWLPGGGAARVAFPVDAQEETGCGALVAKYLLDNEALVSI